MPLPMHFSSTTVFGETFLCEGVDSVSSFVLPQHKAGVDLYRISHYFKLQCI